MNRRDLMVNATQFLAVGALVPILPVSAQAKPATSKYDDSIPAWHPDWQCLGARRNQVVEIRSGEVVRQLRLVGCTVKLHPGGQLLNCQVAGGPIEALGGGGGVVFGPGGGSSASVINGLYMQTSGSLFPPGSELLEVTTRDFDDCVGWLPG